MANTCSLPGVRDGQRRLLEWYQPRRGAYPWRTSSPDAYRVLVSEIMLQQTQATRVAPVYEAFIRRFPSVQVLAAASRADVVAAWAGLGYNRRAVALSEAAKAIVSHHAGRVPSDPQALTTLPGCGPYTAAAVASIAYDVPVPAIDVNHARVVARSRLGREPHEVAASSIRRAAIRWMNGAEPGAWNQAVMDLGRATCRPIPRCGSCPLQRECRSQDRRQHVPNRTLSRQGPFGGSSRQLRGRVVAELRLGPCTLGRLACVTGRSVENVFGAVRALEAEGLVRSGPVARTGGPTGRVRLSP